MSLLLNRVLKQGRWKVGRKLNVTLFSICVADVFWHHIHTRVAHTFVNLLDRSFSRQKLWRLLP